MNKKTSKWIILLMLVLGTAILNYSNMIFASHGADVMSLYGCTATQLAAITSVTYLPGAFLSIFIGRMMDKRGAKGIMVVCMIAATVLFFLRTILTSYWPLFLCTLLAGIFLVCTAVAPAKLIAGWFPPKEIPIAMGIYGSAPGVGIALAFLTSVFTSNIKVQLWIVTVASLVLAVMWIAFGQEIAAGKEAPVNENGPKPSMKRLLKNKNLLIVTWCSFVGCGNCLGVNTYLVTALVEKGMAIGNAAMLATILNFFIIAGGILSGWVVSKMKNINIPYTVSCILGGVCPLLVWLLPVGAFTYIFAFLAGFGFAGAVAINMGRVPLLPLTKEISMEEIGTANGICNVGISLGGFLMPIIVAAIAEAISKTDGISFNAVFIICCVVFIATMLLAFMIPELGENGKLAKAARK